MMEQQGTVSVSNTDEQWRFDGTGVAGTAVGANLVQVSTSYEGGRLSVSGWKFTKVMLLCVDMQ